MQLSENKNSVSSRDICQSIDRLTEAIEEQTQLLRDMVLYPADNMKPPRLLVGIAGPVETIDL